jgi:hypothetical protein
MPTDVQMNVPVGPAQQTTSLILDTLLSTTPAGSTPTAAALARARDYFATGAGSVLGVGALRMVLLLTDGGPSCNPALTCECEACTSTTDPQACDGEHNPCLNHPQACLDDHETLLRIEELRSVGVATLVVGLPGTEPYADQLDEFAAAGASPKPRTRRHYAISEAGGAEQLAAVLTEAIALHNQLGRGRVGGCDIDLSSLPFTPNDDLYVAVDCEFIPRRGSDDNQNWESYVDAAGNQDRIELLGPVCERLQEEGADRIDVAMCPVSYP